MAAPRHSTGHSSTCIPSLADILLYTIHDVAVAEWQYNGRHFSETLEGHVRERFFYINLLKDHFVRLQVLWMAGLVVALLRWKTAKLVVPLLIMILSVFTFFTLAATKLESYTMMVYPLLFVFSGLMVYQVVFFLKSAVLKYSAMAVAVVITGYYNLNYAQVVNHHSTEGEQWYHRVNNAQARNVKAYEGLAAMQLPSNTVIIGLSNFNNIDCMFYTPYTAYRNAFTSMELAILKGGKYKLAAFQNAIPEQFANDSDLLTFLLIIISRPDPGYIFAPRTKA